MRYDEVNNQAACIHGYTCKERQRQGRGLRDPGSSRVRRHYEKRDDQATDISGDSLWDYIRNSGHVDRDGDGGH